MTKGLSQWSAVGTLMHVGSKTFGERQLEISKLGKCNLHFYLAV